MPDRRRNALILLLVAGLVAASAAVIGLKKTRLGLDLKGGVELVYQGKPTPQQPKVTADSVQRALDIIRKRVDAFGVSEPEIQRSGADQIVVGLPDVKNADRAIKQVGKVAQLYFYDWEPNVIGPDGKPDPSNPQVTETPIPSLYEAVVRASKRPAVSDRNNTVNDQWYLFGSRHQRCAGPEESRSDLFAERLPASCRTATQVLKVNPGTVIVRGEKPDTNQKVPKNFNRGWFVVNDNPALTGTDITDPKQEFDQGPGGNGAPIVTMNFTDHGRNQFHDVTRRIAQRGVVQQVPGQPAQNAFQHFAIVLDNELVSRPFIDFNQNPDGIDGRTGAQISGGFTISSAQDLAKTLQFGALPIKLDLISQSQVSATLGKEALHQGLIAGLVGFALVVLFLLAFYRVAGAIAVAALFIYAAYFFALIKLIPITLTLPGIAGLILTIGVAADANIVIFERVKEEIRGGASVARGIAVGYKKGVTAIIDANVVTLMTAFILFILATAGVKGFAFTLGIGTIVSLFTAVLATQAILGSLARTRLVQHPSALGAGKKKRPIRFDFMGASRWFFSMSGVILLVCALSIGGRGVNFGIDFKSGTRITAALQKPASEGQVRSVMSGQGYADAKIQRVNDPAQGRHVVQISTPTLAPGKVQQVRGALQQRFGFERNNFSNQSIGPTFGKTVANSAIIAIIASLLVISIYVALRFEWKYAVPVLIALMHDLLITAGVYSLTDREVTTSTVAALLTILGYSLYDTIIVFDRVRENVPRMPRAAFSQVVNRSMSEVLVRSLATGASALVLVLSLLFFGGETLRDFAFALMVGILSGAYSSIFIASPVLTHWKEREGVYVQRADRIRRETGFVPAYAMATVGGEATAPATVAAATGIPGEEGAEAAPTRRRRRRRTQQERMFAPDQPEQLSPDEFDELVADLDTGDGGPGDAGGAPAEEPPPPAPVRSSPVSSTGGARPKPKKPKQKRPRNRRHGRNR
jgi:SecD/SecF fusion protein